MTSIPIFLAIMAAGGAGAVLRFVVDGAVKTRVARSTSPGIASFPLATALINVTGSFGLGLVTGLGTHAGLPEAWVLIVGGGVMGGYTTFSTASVETVRLALAGRVGATLVNAVGMLVLAIAAAGLGLWSASLA